MKKLRFKIDKHDPRLIYRLMQDIYYSLRNSLYLNQQEEFGHQQKWDWEIVYGPVPFDSSFNDKNKIQPYKDSIQRGDILQPIVIVAGDNIIDGRHKIEAYNQLGYSSAPIARPVGDGNGYVVRDDVYFPLIKDCSFNNQINLDIQCIKCGRKMSNNKNLLKCECGYKFNNTMNMGWTVVNLKEKE